MKMDQGRARLRAGSKVLHKATEQTWILAVDEEHFEDPVQGGLVAACGWPEGWVYTCELELIQPATDEEHIRMLKDWAVKSAGGGHDRRITVARRQLAVIFKDNVLPMLTALRTIKDSLEMHEQKELVTRAMLIASDGAAMSLDNSYGAMLRELSVFVGEPRAGKSEGAVECLRRLLEEVRTSRFVMEERKRIEEATCCEGC